MEYDVFFYEAFEEEEKYLKKYLPAGLKGGFTWETIQESGHKFVPAKIISTRTQSIFPLEWKDQMQVIISRSTGFEHLLEYREAAKASIAMGYLPLYCSRAVAEQAMLLWTALLRKLPRQTRQFTNFNRDGLTGRELQGKNIVVYGVGNIGYEIVKISRGLEMIVTGVDIVERHSDVEYVTPQEGTHRADIIVCAMNLTKVNVNYFNVEFFKRVKPQLVFINISRGEISPSVDVLFALENHLIAAAALDVFDHEKDLSVGLRSGLNTRDDQVRAVNKMMMMENVILTPHNAFNTEEAVERKCMQTMEQINHYLQHNKLKWDV